METAGEARSARRLRIGITVGAIGISVILLRSAASAGDVSSPDPVPPEIELAPAVVVAAGADSIDTNAVRQIFGYSEAEVQAGTGFRIADGRIVTVAHALDGASGVGISEPDGQLVLRRIERGEEVPASLVHIDAVAVSINATFDLASIEDENDGTDGAALQVAASPPKVGDPIVAAGFDEQGRLRLEPGFIVSRTSGSNYAIAIPDVFGIEINSERGWSGGPVVDADGHVVAVLVGREQTSGIAIAAPIEFLP